MILTQGQLDKKIAQGKTIAKNEHVNLSLLTDRDNYINIVSHHDNPIGFINDTKVQEAVCNCSFYMYPGQMWENIMGRLSLRKDLGFDEKMNLFDDFAPFMSNAGKITAIQNIIAGEIYPERHNQAFMKLGQQLDYKSAEYLRAEKVPTEIKATIANVMKAPQCYEMLPPYLKGNPYVKNVDFEMRDLAYKETQRCEFAEIAAAARRPEQMLSQNTQQKTLQAQTQVQNAQYSR